MGRGKSKMDEERKTLEEAVLHINKELNADRNKMVKNSVVIINGSVGKPESRSKNGKMCTDKKVNSSKNGTISKRGRSIKDKSATRDKSATKDKSIAKDKSIVNEDNVKIIDGERFVLMTPNYPDDGCFDFEKTEHSARQYLVPVDRPVRIYCDGVYDLFHYGHARCLQQAKNLFPNVYLIAGVAGDDETVALKGATVFNEVERAESLRHCRYVDEVVEGPWIIRADFVAAHGIDYVCHDDHGIDKPDFLYREVLEMGKFIPTKRTKGVSTTKIITNILRNYDEYVIRNCDRGVSEGDMNMNFLNISRFRVMKKKRELERELREEFDMMKEEFMVALRFWERKRDLFLKKFLEKFRLNMRRIRDFCDRRVGNQ